MLSSLGTSDVITMHMIGKYTAHASFIKFRQYLHIFKVIYYAYVMQTMLSVLLLIFLHFPGLFRHFCFFGIYCFSRFGISTLPTQTKFHSSHSKMSQYQEGSVHLYLLTAADSLKSCIC